MPSQNIIIKIGLPNFQPSFLKGKQLRKLPDGVSIEPKQGDIESQMVDPGDDRDYLTHVVKGNEDWWDIAKQYEDVTGTELKDFNERFPGGKYLTEGQEIKIPRHFVKKDLSNTTQNINK